MVPSRVAGTLAQSSPGSGIFYQGDDVASPGQSSMVTDANSAYSNGPRLQRNTSFNSDTNRIPASPLSFSSNNVSVSGSSIMDGQNSNRNITHLQKKPRLDIKQEEIVMQQIMQRQNTQALIQQQRLRQQQQQFLQSLPPAQRAHVLQQHQMRQQIQNQTIQPVMKRPQDSGICSRRLMKYLYHLRQHPPENTIAYWRKFVAEYYSPRAKKRWCLSLYNNVGNHSLGVFPQANLDAWYCDICGSKSGKGFEATFEVLPRLNRIKFASGVIDELLFLDLPRESTFPSGIMMLEYKKAVEESVYEQLRVVREGHLRIIFSPDLKILSWEFCSRRHEELLPRRLVAPQVNHLVQVAQKCQSTIAESGAEGISQQDLQTNSNMVVTAGRQLAKTLELQSLNDLGFSKTYVRCLQIAEVVGSMKNLMDICQDQKVGPIESLKSYPQHTNSSKFEMQKRHDMAQLSNSRGLSVDPDTLNKFVNGQTNNVHSMVGPGGLSGSTQAALALTNYQNMLMRQNSTNSNNSNQNPSSTFQKTIGNAITNTQSSPYIGGFTHSHQQPMNNGNGMKTQNPSLSGQHGYEKVAKISIAGLTPSRSNNIKMASNIESSPTDRVNEDDHKTPNDPLSDDMVKDIADAFIENGFFSSDFDDNLDFGWKI